MRQEGPDLKGLTDQEHKKEHELYFEGNGKSLVAFSIPHKIQPLVVQRAFVNSDGKIQDDLALSTTCGGKNGERTV